MENIWWTAPTEAENGSLILVTGRDDIDKYRESGKYIYRVEIFWKYANSGMPSDSDGQLMEQATDALHEALRHNKIAVMTGIYTGDGQRDWILYTKNLAIFNKVLNQALEPLPTLPLLIEAYADPDWEEYSRMRSDTYIPPSDD